MPDWWSMPGLSLTSGQGSCIAAVLLCACSGGNGSAGGGDGLDAGPPPALTFVRSVSIGLNLNALDGSGDILGVSYTDTTNAGSSRYLLEIKGNDGSGADRAVVYLENQGRLTLTTEGTMMPSFGNVSRFFARDGHAYLLEGGLSIYRLP